jgi:hypothetical protein
MSANWVDASVWEGRECCQCSMGDGCSVIGEIQTGVLL